MKQDQLINTKNNSTESNDLKKCVAQLKLELEQVSNKVNVFEAQLRSHLTPELIEAQELAVLYKAQKSEKKANRLEQKKRGKNYQAPVGLKPQKHLSKPPIPTQEDAIEKKRLYREAMLHVHPDKFTLYDDHVDLATELTTRLIEIYHHEDLATLKAYHAHLFNHTELTKSATTPLNNDALGVSPDAYLIKQKEQIQQAITEIKIRHTYHVLTTYKDPTTFINELKAYYGDRIQKLRRRTRTKV